MPVRNEAQREAEQSVCEVCVLLCHTHVHASIGRMERANEETLACMDHSVIWPHLGEGVRLQNISYKHSYIPLQRQTSEPETLAKIPSSISGFI
jgi:hypothetical protein